MADTSETPRVTASSVRRGAVALWLVLAVTLAGLTGLAWYALSPPAPARFFRVVLLTPVVLPTGESVAMAGAGTVRIRATVDSPLDPTCLTSTQYFVEFDDGSMWSVAGARYTTPGQLKDAIYQAPVPRHTTRGHAKYFVRDTYNCGLRAQRVESPKVSFQIDGANTPVR